MHLNVNKGLANNVTMVNRTTSHNNEIIEAIKDKSPTFNSKIKRSIKFTDATLAKQSISDYAWKSFEGSKLYYDLARKVDEIVSTKIIILLEA